MNVAFNLPTHVSSNFGCVQRQVDAEIYRVEQVETYVLFKILRDKSRPIQYLMWCFKCTMTHTMHAFIYSNLNVYPQS